MTMTMPETKAGRSSLRPEVFDRLVSQILKDHCDFERDYAERIMDQALAFVQVCAVNPGAQLRPSKAVDIGWHTFILNTREYAVYCQRMANRFIHHEPEEFAPPASPQETLHPTVDALRVAGFTVDLELWSQDSAACTQCHSGCTDCGQGGGKGK